MEEKIRKIFVASALSGNVEENIEIAKKLCRWVALMGHAPFAPHLFFTRFLEENDPEERKMGLSYGMEYLLSCDEIWAFGSITPGMKQEIELAQRHKISISLFPNIREVLGTFE